MLNPFLNVREVFDVLTRGLLTQIPMRGSSLLTPVLCADGGFGGSIAMAQRA